MRYSFFASFFVCTVFTFVACKSPAEIPSETTESYMETVSEFSSENATLPPSYTQDTAVWDLKNVDISRIQSSRKLVALTFDDAPSAKLDSLISVFASFNEQNPDCEASATLFCNGSRLDNSSMHTLTSAYTLGWELGNHSFSHADFTTLTNKEIQEEISKTDKLLYRIDGKAKHLFRPPYGKLQKEDKPLIEVPIIYWNVDTLDWAGKTAFEIENTIVSNLQDGAIILLHDGYGQTVESVKRLLPTLKELGYQAVTVSQMAKANGCTLKNGGAYIRARKSKTLR